MPRRAKSPSPNSRFGLFFASLLLCILTSFSLVACSRAANFQLNLLRWVGANTDPDIFEFVYSTKRFPPDGANRGHYRNPRIDTLTDQIHVEMDQGKRKALSTEVQRILADDLPYLPLWFSDVVSVHRRFTPSGSREGSGELNLSPTGDFDFLATLASGF
jgi:peptide/nickel transport system substrate-binding protein